MRRQKKTSDSRSWIDESTKFKILDASDRITEVALKNLRDAAYSVFSFAHLTEIEVFARRKKRELDHKINLRD